MEVVTVVEFKAGILTSSAFLYYVHLKKEPLTKQAWLYLYSSKFAVETTQPLKMSIKKTAGHQFFYNSRHSQYLLLGMSRIPIKIFVHSRFMKDYDKSDINVVSHILYVKSRTCV